MSTIFANLNLRRMRRFIGGFLVSTLPLAATLSAGAANAFLVTTDADAGPGSLRQAVADANVSGGTITFSNVTGTIALAGGELVLSHNVSIVGPGANDLAVRGGLADPGRVFRVAAGSTSSISGLTIRDGRFRDTQGGGGVLNAGTLTMSRCIIRDNTFLTPGFGGPRNPGGGGLCNVGTLTLEQCLVSGNSATPAGGDASAGGGIFNAGTLLLNQSVVVGNVTAAPGVIVTQGRAILRPDGAGIFNSGTLWVTQSTIASNTCGMATLSSAAGSDGGFGGGLYNEGKASLTASTFHANQSGAGSPGGGTPGLPQAPPGGQGGNGGGLFNGGTMFMTNCTLFGNRAGDGARGGNSIVTVPPWISGDGGNGGDGAGICNTNTLVMANCTVSAGMTGAGGAPGTPVSMSGSPGAPGRGGGVWNQNGTVRIINSLIVSNASSSPAIDVGGTFVSLGYNLIGVTNGSVGFGATGDLVNVDPRLGPLQDNGGPTPTMALFPGSRAIDAGSPTDVAATDQRGLPRPIDGNGDGIARADIGAVEVLPANAFLVTTDADAGPGSLRQAVADANGSGGTIYFSGVTGTIELSSGEIVFSNRVTVVGPGANDLAIRGGLADPGRVFRVAAGSTSSISGLTIRDGRQGDIRGGGGVLNAGVLTMSRCVIRDNTFRTFGFGGPRNPGGGGLCNVGTLTLEQCLVSGNSATPAGGDASAGGGIFNTGTLFLKQSVVVGNVTAAPGFAFVQGRAVLRPDGAGIFNSGTLWVTQSTLASNTCGMATLSAAAGSDGGFGGGLYNEGTAFLTASTVSANQAGAGSPGGGIPAVQGSPGGQGGNGGGIFNGGTMFVTNCTLHGNRAGDGARGGNPFDRIFSGDGGNGGDGAGICNTSALVLVNVTVSAGVAGVAAPGGVGMMNLGRPGTNGRGGGVWNQNGTVRVINSLIASNVSFGAAVDVGGTFVSLGYNLISVTNGSVGFGATGDLVNVDPRLGPLEDNGGPTRTMTLLAGSPAIDGGLYESGPLLDQRGVPRPTDGDGDGLNESDIGAVEVVPPTLQELIDATPAGGTISLAPGIYRGNFVLTKDVRIIGPSATNTAIHGNGFSNTVLVIQSNVTVEIENVVIANGVTDRRISLGGGIRNDGRLTLRRCVVRGNRGISFAGGGRPWGGIGIANLGDLKLIDTIVSDNIMEIEGGGDGPNGGGIYNLGRLEMLRGQLVRNTDSRPIPFAVSRSRVRGAGLFNAGSARLEEVLIANIAWAEGAAFINAITGELELVRCNVTANASWFGSPAVNRGRAVLRDCAIHENAARSTPSQGVIHTILAAEGSSMMLTNCTITANNLYLGGIIYNPVFDVQIGAAVRADGAVTLVHCTVAGNMSQRAPAGIEGNVTVRDSIIAGNIALGTNATQGSDCGGTIASLGYNLIGSALGATFTGDLTGNLLNVNPRLGPLQDNGGPTPTMTPLAGSPAIDAGSTNDAVAIDQRGLRRPVDGDGNGIARADIGAVEALGHKPWIYSWVRESAQTNRGSLIGLPGTNYVIEGSAEVIGRPWTSIGPVRADEQGRASFAVPVTPGTPRQFYRAREQ